MFRENEALDKIVSIYTVVVAEPKKLEYLI